jgi:hypothetical protein
MSFYLVLDDLRAAIEEAKPSNRSEFDAILRALESEVETAESRIEELEDEAAAALRDIAQPANAAQALCAWGRREDRRKVEKLCAAILGGHASDVSMILGVW